MEWRNKMKKYYIEGYVKIFMFDDYLEFSDVIEGSNKKEALKHFRRRIRNDFIKNKANPIQYIRDNCDDLRKVPEHRLNKLVKAERYKAVIIKKTEEIEE